MVDVVKCGYPIQISFYNLGVKVQYDLYIRNMSYYVCVLMCYVLMYDYPARNSAHTYAATLS